MPSLGRHSALRGVGGLTMLFRATGAVAVRGFGGSDGFVRAAGAVLRFGRSTSTATPPSTSTSSTVPPPSRDLLGMGEDALIRLAKDFGQPGYRGKQIHDAMYVMRKAGVDDITQLPEPFRVALKTAGMDVGRRAPSKIVSSPDGTKKVLITLHCGSIIEAVGIPQETPGVRAAANAQQGMPLYEDGDELEDEDGEELDYLAEDDDEEEDGVDLDTAKNADGWVRLGSELGVRQRQQLMGRGSGKRQATQTTKAGDNHELKTQKKSRFTVCVSSQVGCAMRCSFCATGKQGFKRNLLSSEIVNQVLALEDVFQRKCTNVVMMGMGEPLMNLKEVLKAHASLNKDVGIGGRRFTISTVGVPNALSKLAAHKLQATLAVSLHAPDQALREKLVPSAKAYPLENLLEDCKRYKDVTGKRVTFEYTLLQGENDSVEHAKALAKILRQKVGRGCHVNLLPWNPVADAPSHKRPSAGAVKRFSDALTAERGITHTVRRTRGLEADAACGQLTGVFERKIVESSFAG